MIQRALVIFLVITTMVTASGSSVAATRHKHKSTTTTTTPAAPTTANVLVNWDAPVARTDGALLDASELASFDIYYFDEVNGTIQTVHVADPSLRQWRLTALPKSTTYHFSIVTTDVKGGVSAASEAVSIVL